MIKDPDMIEGELVEDAELAKLSQAELWLNNTSQRVEQIQQVYGELIVSDAQSYRDVKAARTQLRKDIDSIEQERKDFTRAIEDMVREFKHQAATVLTPLTSLEASYKVQLDSFERKVLAEKKATVEEAYIELGGVLNDGLVPFERIWEKYAQEKKWANKGTSTEKCRQDLEQIVSKLSQDYQTISNLDMTEAERTELKTEYFNTLDFGAALKNAAERRQQAQRVSELDAMNGYAPEPEPPVVEQQPVQQEPATGWIVEMQVATQEQLQGLIAYCKEHGITGVARRAE